jgi:hypothetical protein
MSGSFPLFLSQGTVAAEAHAEAAVVTLFRKAYLVFTGRANLPAHSDGSSGRVEGFFKSEGTAQFTDEATGALVGLDGDGRVFLPG